jgi:hypothetical protein
MDLKKLRNMQKVSSQFSSITMHSTKTKDGTYTIFYKDTILVSHIPEEALRDYIVAELDALMKKFAGKIEGYLTEIENSARQVNLDFSGQRDDAVKIGIAQELARQEKIFIPEASEKPKRRLFSIGFITKKKNENK